MTRCATCDAPVADGQTACAKCGATAPAAAPAGPAASFAGGGRRRSFRLDELFHGTDHVVVGRAAESGIPLPHPRVSLYHALLIRGPDGIEVVDLDSATGVTANGRRVRLRAVVRDGQRFGVGPFLFTLAGPELHCLDSSQSLRLEARGVEKEVAAHGGGRRKLLDGIDLVVEPGEFVCLLGPSGSGKSTLMDCLNGRRRATGGRVLANGEDFYENFDQFRQSLGYVPQRDIVHRQLTVARALYYTAQLRLPRDTAGAELEARVEEVLRQMEMGPHRHTTVGQLSGGQVKRVSLGAELLARPSLLFVDEATSGLDAGTEARMMRLFRRLADDGKSVVCITHNIENVDQCHLVLVLASGRLMYYGPPADAPAYFGVRRLGQVYDRLGERDAKDWEADFRATPLHREFIEQRFAASTDESPEAGGTPAAAAAAGEPPVVISSEGRPAEGQAAVEANVNGQAAAGAGPESSAADRLAAGLAAGRAAAVAVRSRAGRGLTSLRVNWFQFLVLTRRYAELLVRDRKSLRLLLMQAPIVGLILAIGLTHIDYMTPLPRNRHLDDHQKAVLQTLHDFNYVLSAVEDGTVDDPAARAHLKELKFNVLQPDPAAGMKLRQKSITGYEMAGQLQKKVGRTAALLAGVPGGGPDTRPVRARLLALLDVQDDLQVVVGDAAASGTGPATAPAAAGATAGATAGGAKGAISLRQLVAMVHAMAKLDTRHPDQRKDLPRILLDLDANKFTPVVPDQDRPSYAVPTKAWAVMFILSVAVFWFGCNNAVKEVVKEQAVYARERAVGLRILPYLGSKFLVQGLIAVFQVFVLLLVVHGMFRAAGVKMPTAPGLNGSDQCIYFLPYGQQFGILALLSLTAVACGLLISACVSSSDRANTLAPYVLIPQIILAGSFIPIEEGLFMKTLAGGASPVYWAFRVLQHGWNTLPDYVPNFHPDFPLWRTCVALGVQTTVLLAAAAFFLRRKDTGRG